VYGLILWFPERHQTKGRKEKEIRAAKEKYINREEGRKYKAKKSERNQKYSEIKEKKREIKQIKE
jgi:hypothetical protein